MWHAPEQLRSSLTVYFTSPYFVCGSGLNLLGVAAGAVRLVGRRAPGGGVGVGRVAAQAGERHAVVARVAAARDVLERVRRPGRRRVALVAVEVVDREGHVRRSTGPSRWCRCGRSCSRRDAGVVELRPAATPASSGRRRTPAWSACGSWACRRPSRRCGSCCTCRSRACDRRGSPASTPSSCGSCRSSLSLAMCAGILAGGDRAVVAGEAACRSPACDRRAAGFQPVGRMAGLAGIAGLQVRRRSCRWRSRRCGS